MSNLSLTWAKPESKPNLTYVPSNFDTCLTQARLEFFFHWPKYGLTFYHNVGETTDYLSVGCSINRINLKID